MANFSALKTAIQNAIRQNGNEEITGDVLQQILLSVVNTMGDGAINTIEQNLSSETLARQNGDNTLQSHIDAEARARGNADTQLQNAINAIKANIDNGYVYAGIATPTTTPVSGKVFYIATAAGTYTNFGGQVLTQGINILRFNGSAWSHQQLIGIDDEPTAGSDNLVKSKGIISFLDKNQCIILEGANETVVTKSFTVKAGKTYLIYPQQSTWDVALNSRSYKYQGYSITDSNNTLLYVVYIKSGHDVLEESVKPYYLTSEIDQIITINCRCVSGSTVRVNILDVTELIDSVPKKNSKNLVLSGGVYSFIGQDLSFYWSSGRKPMFIEGTDGTYKTLKVILPDTFMRVLNNKTGEKLSQHTPENKEFILNIVEALVYNIDSGEFSVKSFGASVPDVLDSQTDCVALYNFNGTYGGALLPYLGYRTEVKEYDITDLVRGAVQPGGSISDNNSYLAVPKFAIDTPCYITIKSKSYQINGNTYYPFYRVAAQYNDGTASTFIVGGYNNADTPTCDSIYLGENIKSICFSVKYAQTATGPNIDTEGDDALIEAYENGDIQLYISTSLREEVSDLKDDVSDLKEEVSDLKDVTPILKLYPETEYLPKVATLKKLVPYNFSAAATKNTPLVFLMFTDIHGDINNLKRIITWKNKYANYIDDVINAGDTVTDNVTNYDSVMPSYFAEGGDKVLMALGNHDVSIGGAHKGWSADNNLTIQQVYDKYTALMDSSLNIVKPTFAEIGDIANYANFYYKDYTSGVVSNKPVRLIVLDSCITEASIIASGTGNDTTATIAYQNAQLTWFVAKLNEAKTLGYAVAIMCHCTPAITEKVSPSAFTIYPTSISSAYIGATASIPMTFVEAVDDFILANGEFVCWLIGHTHANHIATVTGHDNQLVVGFNTATSRSYASSPTNPYRTGYNGAAPITETTDAFCMVQIDTYYKVVRLVNVGTDYDMYGRKKDMIAINYISREILL